MVLLPAVRSEAVAGARRTRFVEGIVFESYPRGYAPTDLIGHLRFAMRYEPLHLGVYNAVFKALDHRTLENWVRRERTGVFARRAWYLYELLTEKTLDVPDVPRPATRIFWTPDCTSLGRSGASDGSGSMTISWEPEPTARLFEERKS